MKIMLNIRIWTLFLLSIAIGQPLLHAGSAEIYDFEVMTIDGIQTDLQPYRDKVLLIVNVASKCGFTDQYNGLETLFRTYADQGFAVLGFPCNQFGSQEPGTEAQIATFCRLTYGVTFPMHAKIEVNGPNAHPLYRFLKARQPGDPGDAEISWNFTKFLVDRNGEVVKRYESSVEPESLAADIEKLL